MSIVTCTIEIEVNGPLRAALLRYLTARTQDQRGPARVYTQAELENADVYHIYKPETVTDYLLLSTGLFEARLGKLYTHYATAESQQVEP